MNKPYAESCDQNKDAILAVIEPLLEKHTHILEIGSGTGQHAVYFTKMMPHLVWHCSDQEEYLPGIKLWVEEGMPKSTPTPLCLDVASSLWPQLQIDAVFSANTVHIMHWAEVQAMFSGVGDLLTAGGRFLLYGPFNYDNKYTSDSNARFDIWLKRRDPQSGIRDFEALQLLAGEAGLTLEDDVNLPANNRILSWQKKGTP